MLVAASLIGAGVGSARAQSTPSWGAAISFDQPSYLTPSPLRANNPLTNRSPEYSGIPALGWLLYPQLSIGPVYNDNLTQSQSNRTGGLGARLQGDVTGVFETGVSSTTVFADADAYLYPEHTSGDTYDGRVGVNQIWRLASQLTVKAQVELDQLSYSAFGGLVETPGGGAASLVAPQKYRQLVSSAAVQKSLGRAFLGASIGETATMYDALVTSAGSLSQDYRDSAVTTLTQRAGYWITPMLYGYGETSENWRQYANDPFTSNGYRAVAGLGSDRIGLFRGEVYGGYQEQFYTSALLGAAKSPVFGGKLFYYLTRAWTLSGSINETFNDTNNPTPSNPLGSPARVMAALGIVEYRLGRLWSAQGSVEFDASRYLGAARIDDTLTTGLVINREIARNLNVNVDYKYILNRSNAVGSSYVNNIFGATATYKF